MNQAPTQESINRGLDESSPYIKKQNQYKESFIQ